MGIYTCLKSLIMKNPITSTLWNVFERVISSLLNALIKGSNIDIDEPNINVDDDDHKEQPNNININDDPYEDYKVKSNDPKDHNDIIVKPPVSMVNHPCQPLHHKIEISIINNNNNNNNNPNTPKDHNTPESSSKTEKRNISNGKETHSGTSPFGNYKQQQSFSDKQNMCQFHEQRKIDNRNTNTHGKNNKNCMERAVKCE
ncbi:hypothetical protein G4B88_016100 [Cannabis sativa]|uniref:Uncharacterized protein n=1 Tax=Cannabis sativa TaxID=3483 RepID=A0A7J6FJ95_CANSA|nr:hypothetical protein G4B88_016100 [Cannabis sativa]